MDDVAPTLPTLNEPPRRERQFAVTAAVSVVLHLLVLGFILLPRVQSQTPVEPKSINVDLVPPSEVISVEPSSSAASSSEVASSAEASSSAAASSAEPASSAEAASSAPASSEPSVSAPVPQARPILIPVGPSEMSSEPTSSAEDTSASASEESAASEVASSAEPSSAASAADTASLLTTSAPEASDGVDPTASSAADNAPPPDTPKPPAGTLHAAKRYYLDDMLSVPQMAKVRDALKTLPKDKRLAQTCNIEAIGQLGNAGRNYAPDALVASAFAKPMMDGTTYSVGNGAFRSKGKWIGLSYDCTLSKDLGTVASFTYRIGGDVTAPMLPKVTGSQKP